MLNLFFSYSHKDEGLRDELDKHLSILKRTGIITTWHDRRIKAGDELNETISRHLKDADIILLLVSSDFLASAYCYENELHYAMQMHRRKEAIVIPVILRPCEWQDALFGKLLAIPTDGKPVIKFSNLDEAFLDIVTHIKSTIAAINNRAKSEQSISGAAILEDSISRPRSSNLRIKKKFSNAEIDKFLDDAFDYMSNYFEESLTELKVRNAEIDFRFKRLDTQTFTASLYVNGKTKSECMIFMGGMLTNGISYSSHISSSRNALNENFSVDDDGYNLYLKSFGMFYAGNKKDAYSFEGASEHYWERFILPLQNDI